VRSPPRTGITFALCVQQAQRSVCAIGREAKVMSRTIAALVIVGFSFAVGSAYAQESAGPGPGFVEVTYMPAGAAYFTAKGDAPSFGNY
jgi:hypothetical protein